MSGICQAKLAHSRTCVDGMSGDFDERRLEGSGDIYTPYNAKDAEVGTFGPVPTFSFSTIGFLISIPSSIINFLMMCFRTEKRALLQGFD
jgi:hypothetical protein